MVQQQDRAGRRQDHPGSLLQPGSSSRSHSSSTSLETTQSTTSWSTCPTLPGGSVYGAALASWLSGWSPSRTSAAWSLGARTAPVANPPACGQPLDAAAAAAATATSRAPTGVAHRHHSAQLIDSYLGEQRLTAELATIRQPGVAREGRLFVNISKHSGFAAVCTEPGNLDTWGVVHSTAVCSTCDRRRHKCGHVQAFRGGQQARPSPAAVLSHC